MRNELAVFDDVLSTFRSEKAIRSDTKNKAIFLVIGSAMLIASVFLPVSTFGDQAIVTALFFVGAIVAVFSFLGIGENVLQSIVMLKLLRKSDRIESDEVTLSIPVVREDAYKTNMRELVTTIESTECDFHEVQYKFEVYHSHLNEAAILNIESQISEDKKKELRAKGLFDFKTPSSSTNKSSGVKKKVAV